VLIGDFVELICLLSRSGLPVSWERLEFARGLLENSGMKIADVCYESGFESVAHFSRVFKQKFGVVPSVLK